MAMRFPMHGVGIRCERLPECIEADLFVVLKLRSFAGDDTTRKHDVGVGGAGCFRQPKQRVLAGPARTDHQNEPARPDRLRYRQGFAHATRCPSRQTSRTTGISRAMWTRITSARLPTAISPRSCRPTASAGDLVTVRTAAARSIAGTCRGNCIAPINRLEGM